MPPASGMPPVSGMMVECIEWNSFTDWLQGSESVSVTVSTVGRYVVCVLVLIDYMLNALLLSVHNCNSLC